MPPDDLSGGFVFEAFVLRASLSDMENIWGKIKNGAKQIKNDLVVLYHALKDASAPLSAKVVGFITVAYALSPIDLIPDFIPVLGMLDDMVIVPLGLWAAWKLMPDEIIAAYQARRATLTQTLPDSKAAAIFIVVIWLVIVWWGLSLLWARAQA